MGRARPFEPPSLLRNASARRGRRGRPPTLAKPLPRRRRNGPSGRGRTPCGCANAPPPRSTSCRLISGAARDRAQKAEHEAATLREAEAVRKGRGVLARLRAALRGE